MVIWVPVPRLKSSVEKDLSNPLQLLLLRMLRINHSTNSQNMSWRTRAKYSGVYMRRHIWERLKFMLRKRLRSPCYKMTRKLKGERMQKRAKMIATRNIICAKFHINYSLTKIWMLNHITKHTQRRCRDRPSAAEFLFMTFQCNMNVHWHKSQNIKNWTENKKFRHRSQKQN